MYKKGGEQFEGQGLLLLFIFHKNCSLEGSDTLQRRFFGWGGGGVPCLACETGRSFLDSRSICCTICHWS